MSIGSENWVNELAGVVLIVVLLLNYLDIGDVSCCMF